MNRRIGVVALMLGLATAVHAFGCKGALEGASVAPDDAGTVESGTAEGGPYRITCSLAMNGSSQKVVFMTDEPSERTLIVGVDAVPVHVKLGPVPDAPDLVDLTVDFPRSALEKRFRLARDVMPPYEFLGYHGFTGSSTVRTPGSTGPVNLICEASPRNEERPKPSGPTSVPEPLPAVMTPTPFRIECTTAVGDAPGETFNLEAPTTETRTLAGQPVKLSLTFGGSPYEARNLYVNVPGRIEQLYQLAYWKPVVDVSRRPGGLTGTTLVRPLGDAAAPPHPLERAGADAGDADKPILIACSAAPP